MKSILVLMTCHNRAKLTERGIIAASASAKFANVSLFWAVTDDGSTDGTSNILVNLCKNLKLIKGDGNLYWSRGMRAAWEGGRDSFSPCDFVLWLNDDVEICESGLLDLISAMELGDASIVSGACAQDSELKYMSYGAFHLKSKRPTSLREVMPNNTIQEIDTFNGNVVLMKWEVPNTIEIQPFSPMFGDIDFGLRARRYGFRMVTAKKFVGICFRDSLDFRWLSPEKNYQERIKDFFGPKGMVYSDLLRYNVAHTGFLLGTILTNLFYFKSLVKVLKIEK